jgi:triosephosphate isomerase
MKRKPVALTNWKMAMTISETQQYMRDLQRLLQPVLDLIDVIICPPYTAIWAAKQVMDESMLQLGAQNMASSADIARTGQISAELLVDAGCRWVILGHWEVRRQLGDDDEIVNRKMHLALKASLKPVVLIGESCDESGSLPAILQQHLEQVFEDCTGPQVASCIIGYEPEGKIGVSAPASPEHVREGCQIIRDWLRNRWGEQVAGSVRFAYGGSVSREYADQLLAIPDIDGLGASRQGRVAETFAEIVWQVARQRLGGDLD